jgi:polyisoprenoid-binding protein YceI
MTGLPEAVGMNQAVTFQLTGDLTVRDITNSVTFEVTATMVSEERLEASATTNVTRDAYGLTIPNVPGVANVSNDVILEMDLVARLVES